MKWRSIEVREEALRMYFEDRKSYKRIGSELEIPWETVKSWIHRYKKENGVTLLPPAEHDMNKPMSRRSARHISTVAGSKEQENRIKRLEMQVDLLRAFLSEEERR